MTRAVLITGGMSDIGRAAAAAFARAGYAVAVNYRRHAGQAEAFACELQEQHGARRALALKADIRQRTEVSAMMEAAWQELGGLTVLINNAGINKDRAFLEMSDEEWHTVLDTILTGSFLCAQEFARRFTGESGCILNLGATTGLKGRKNGVNYCSARAGILTFTKCLALELAPRIRVNTITPGWIDTAEVRERYQLELPENLAKAEASVPLGRLGRPEEIASLMVYLAEAGSYISGQNFFVDGGYYMH